jgi:hypothetical protein
VRGERQIVNTCRSNDHAVSRITVEGRRKIIDGYNDAWSSTASQERQEFNQLAPG